MLIICNPNSSNNESGNSLLVIQLTVVEKEAIKINCLQDILSAFDVTLRSKIDRKIFLAVTPMINKISTLQVFHNKQSDVIQYNDLSNDIQEFEQWAYQYFIPETK